VKAGGKRRSGKGGLRWAVARDVMAAPDIGKRARTYQVYSG
jgi:hypothetical protein